MGWAVSGLEFFNLKPGSLGNQDPRHVPVGPAKKPGLGAKGSDKLVWLGHPISAETSQEGGPNDQAPSGGLPDGYRH